MLTDPTDLTKSVIDMLASAKVTRLEDLATVPEVPGAYALGLDKLDRRSLYAGPVKAGAPLYGGSSVALRSRLCRYRSKMRETGLDSAVPIAAWLPFDDPVGLGWARLCEVVLQVQLPLLWNAPGPLHGIGSNLRGGNRDDPVAPWWRVHGPVPDLKLEAAALDWWALHGATSLPIFAR